MQNQNFTKHTKFILLVVFVVQLLFIYCLFIVKTSSWRTPVSDYVSQNTEKSVVYANGSFFYGSPASDSVKISVTCCGLQVIDNLRVLVKSIVISAKRNTSIHFIIFGDDNIMRICEFMEEITGKYLTRVTYEIKKAQFPNVANPNVWKTTYKPCASQRLFYPLIIKYDSVLHLDVDTLILSPISELWNYFRQMNSTQLAAMAADNTNPDHLKRLAMRKTPYINVNSGVMHMNLTRMRELNFFEEAEQIYQKYRNQPPMYDQDILNVYFYIHPERLLHLPCKWNYLRDSCDSNYPQLCESAENEGIALFHGTGGSFSKLAAFRAVFHSFLSYQFGTDVSKNLYEPIMRDMNRTLDSNCGKFLSRILKFANV